MVQIKPNPQKDWDKNKESLRKTYAQSLAGAQFEKALKDQESRTKIQWTVKDFEVVYDLSKAVTAMSVDEALKVEKEAKQLLGAQGSDDRLLDYVRYSAIDAAWGAASPKQREDLKAERADVLSAMLQYVEDPGLRMDLADTYIDLKKGKEALEVLLGAAQNSPEYDKATEERFGEIDKRVKKMIADKMIDAKDSEGIEQAHQQWLKEKADNDRTQAELAKQDADQKKQQEKASKDYIEAYKKSHHGQAPPEANSGSGTAPSTPAGK